MTRVRVLVAGLLMTLGVVLVGPSATAAPAADRCAVRTGSTAAVVAAAQGHDSVFAATITSAKKVTLQTSGVLPPTYWRHEIRVVESFRGTARAHGKASMVLTPMSPRPGAPLKQGATYLFFAERHSGSFSAARCGGVVQLRKGLTKKLSDQLNADLGSTSNGVPVTLADPSGGVRDLPALSRLVAPGAGVALFGLLGLLLVRRLGRERH